jgi:hypothetical protein
MILVEDAHQSVPRQDILDVRSFIVLKERLGIS